MLVCPCDYERSELCIEMICWGDFNDCLPSTNGVASPDEEVVSNSSSVTSRSVLKREQQAGFNCPRQISECPRNSLKVDRRRPRRKHKGESIGISTIP